MKAFHTQGVMNMHPALLGRKGVSTGVALRQRVQQGLRLLQIRGVKAFGGYPFKAGHLALSIIYHEDLRALPRLG